MASTLVDDGFQRLRQTDVAGDEVVRRGGVVRTAPARAGRHAVRHDDHGGNPLDAEQAEQPRVDGDARVVTAKTIPDPLCGRCQAACADAAQHQRHPAPCRLARPLPPARGGNREAGENEDFRHAAVSACALNDPRGVPLGRERGGGLSGAAGNGLPRGPAGAVERPADDRAGPGAERLPVVTACLAAHLVRQPFRIRIGRAGAYFFGANGIEAARRQHHAGKQQSCRTLRKADHGVFLDIQFIVVFQWVHKRQQLRLRHSR